MEPVRPRSRPVRGDPRPTPLAHVPAPDGAAATILTAGDTADCNGGSGKFDRCYQPTWGRFLDRTRPAQGNHDVATAGAAGYYQPFGTSAGPRPQGYYNYDLGAWHLVVLNSNCDQVGGCGPDSALLAWLCDDLAAATTSNLLVYWHHPRWSSGHHGNDPALDTIWRTLALAGTDIVLNRPRPRLPAFHSPRRRRSPHPRRDPRVRRRYRRQEAAGVPT